MGPKPDQWKETKKSIRARGLLAYLDKHEQHKRKGTPYVATCATCQREQLGPLAAGQVRAVRNPVHKQWHYPPCP